MAILISYPISTRDTHISPRAEGPLADMDVEGWYGVWYENCHIIIYLSYIFLSDKFAYLISYAESKARPPSAPNVVICFFFFFFFFFLHGQKSYHPRDLVIWVFLPGQKKAVSPTWPIITPFALHKGDMCLKAVLVSHMQNEHIFL